MRNPETLPSAEDPCGPCPSCGRVSNFAVEYDQLYNGTQGAVISWPVDNKHRAVRLECQGCSIGVITIEEHRVIGKRILRGVGPELQDGWEEVLGWRPVHWWPTPGAGPLHPAVPTDIAEAYDEAVRCLAVDATRAAAAMFRSTFERIVHDLADKANVPLPERKPLGPKLEAIAGAQGVTPGLIEWIRAVKDWGDAAIHVDRHPPSRHDVEQLQGMAHSLLQNLYEIPAKVIATRAAYAQRQAPTTPIIVDKDDLRTAANTAGSFNDEPPF